jgi:hypothetical protein
MVSGVQDVIEGSLDINGGEQPTVVETNTVAKVKDIGERVGELPRLSQVAVKVHLIIALKKAAEEKAIDALGLCVGG